MKTGVEFLDLNMVRQGKRGLKELAEQQQALAAKAEFLKAGSGTAEMQTIGPLRDALLAAAEAAADVAGAVIRPLFRSVLQAQTKSDRSPVTIADRTAEQAMRAVLSERFPDHGILGEEFGHDRPGASHQWVLDPVDGTRAFITGRPTFGTLIALLRDGVPVLGVIDQAITGERWVGVAGEPTRFRGAHGRAGTRACPALDGAELSCTSPAVFGPGDRAKWDRLAPRVGRITWGGDCYSYGLLALGHLDIVADSTMKLWDWAALVPVVEGAGGRVTDWSGRKLRADGDGRVLAVGDPALLAHVAVLIGGDEG